MRQKIGRVCMVLGALLILAAAALLAYNKWDASLSLINISEPTRP